MSLNKDIKEGNDGLPDIEFTGDEDADTKLVSYYWSITWLIFASTIIGYLVLFITKQIDGVLLGVLALNAINSIIIGSAMKLVQKKMEKITGKYNQEKQKKSALILQRDSLVNKVTDLEKRLNERDAELIAMKQKLYSTN